MSALTRGRRRAIAAAGLGAACALAAPAVAAHASTGSYTPNPHQWYFSKWSIQQDVWPVTEGSGVTVAVVDSGVANIPDLQGAVEPGADMLGYPGNGQKDFASDGGHGTAVASLIAGQGAEGGPVGLAPQAKILPIHVIDPSTSSGVPIANGIKYAVNHGANVINLSIGGTAPSPTSCDPNEQEAVAYALAHNVVVVAGSGDTNVTGPGPSDPGTCAGVLTVGGVEPNGSLWQESVEGPQVSVAAPGDQLYTIGSDGQSISTTSNGTSFSAPLVSGAAALIRAKYPSMPWYQVDQRLINTAVATGSVPNNGTGYGIININKALNVSQYPVKSSAPNPPYTRYREWRKSTGQSGSSSGQSATSNDQKSGSGSSTLWIIVGVVIVLIIVVVLIIVLAARGRSRRGPRGPGGPGGGYAPNTYAPPGQYPSPRGQYPQPGQYAPPVGQYPPPGQQPPPGQYPPPGGQQYPPQGPYQPGPAQPGQYPPPQQ